MGRRSTTKKCCCPSDFYLLTPCPDQSSKCPDGGVFVSKCAYNYLKHTTIFLIHNQIVIVYSYKCCLIADLTTDDISYTLEEVIDLGGIIIYCRDDNTSHGTDIEDYNTHSNCENIECEPPNGACCYDYAGGRACDDITEEECFEDHEGENPVYHGNGTCCTGSGNECTEGEEEIDCDDPPPDPICDMKLGTCVYQDVDGEDVFTDCGVTEDGDGCPSTVSLQFSFPAATLWQSSNPFVSSCSNSECGLFGFGSACQNMLTLPSITGGGALTRDCLSGGSDNADGFGCWDNVDNQEDYNPTQNVCWSLSDDGTPYNDCQGERWTFGGGLNGWITHTGSDCAPDWCVNHPSCDSCPDTGGQNDPDYDWAHCWDIAGWNCPFCRAYRMVNWWWQAKLVNISTVSSYCQCNAPCSCWKLTIIVKIGMTQCLENAPQGGQGLGCDGMVNPDPNQDCHAAGIQPCCVPLGGDTVWYSHSAGFGVEWYVAMDGCTCPNDGVSSGNAQTVLSTQVDANEERCRGACGCGKWISIRGAKTSIETDPFLSGSSFGIT